MIPNVEGFQKEWLVRRAASCLVLYAIVALSPAFASAQTAAATQRQSSAQSQTVQQPQELKVTEYSLPPDKLAKAEALYTTRTMLYLFGMGFGIVILWILLKLLVAPALRDLAERASKNSFVQALVFVPLLMFLIAV